MKIHSDTLADGELYAALPAGISFEVLHDSGSRSRKHAWTFSLESNHSNRRKNTGLYGASHHAGMAATYTEHGDFMAALYRIDPSAIIGPYKSAEDFHRMTYGAFLPENRPRIVVKNGRPQTEWLPRGEVRLVLKDAS